MTRGQLDEEQRLAHNAYNRAWRQLNHDKFIAQQRAAGARFRVKNGSPSNWDSAASLRWQAAHPARHALVQQTRNIVRTALKNGLLQRPTSCEQCGGSGRPIQAAHADYDQPLVVRWLCVTCHVRWDHSNPKTRRAA